MKKNKKLKLNKIKKVLIDCDFTQETAAESIGVCRQHLNGVINGRYKSEIVAYKLSRLLKTPVNDLFPGQYPDDPEAA